MTTSNDPIDDLMPEAGTWAHKAITHLRGVGSEVRMTTAELCQAIGYTSRSAASHLPQFLLEPVRRGLLYRRRVPGAATVWGLGYLFDSDAPEPSGPNEEGERVAQRTLPAAAVNSIFALADERRAAPFSVSLSSDGRLSIERYGRVLVELTDNERRQLLRAAGYGVIAAEVKPL